MLPSNNPRQFTLALETGHRAAPLFTRQFLTPLAKAYNRPRDRRPARTYPEVEANSHSNTLLLTCEALHELIVAATVPSAVLCYAKVMRLAGTVDAVDARATEMAWPTPVPVDRDAVVDGGG